MNLGDWLWAMVVFFFWFMAIWIFIQIFADIFHRRDLSGAAKAGWIVLIFVLPFLGALIYMIARPKMTEQDREDIARVQEAQRRLSGYSPAEELEKLAKLRDAGELRPRSTSGSRRGLGRDLRHRAGARSGDRRVPGRDASIDLRRLRPMFPTSCSSHPPCSTVAIRKASANPTVVARPATAPPCLNASGIIVSASIVRIAPAANPCTMAIVAEGASPRTA